MALADELFKLNVACSNPLFVRYRRHPVQLRIVAKARSEWSDTKFDDVKGITDRLVYRHYID